MRKKLIAQCQKVERYDTSDFKEIEMWSMYFVIEDHSPPEYQVGL